MCTYVQVYATSTEVRGIDTEDCLCLATKSKPTIAQKATVDAFLFWVIWLHLYACVRVCVCVCVCVCVLGVVVLTLCCKTNTILCS